MCDTYTWRKTKHINKRQTHLLVREDVTYGLWSQRFSWNKFSGRESQGAWRQDVLIGGKLPVVKITLTLTKSFRVSLKKSRVVSLQSAAGKQTRRRSSTDAPSGGVGGGGAPTVVSRCVATPCWLWRQSQVSEDTNTDAEEARTLEAVTRQPVKI
jgi:hypothetical protein